MKWSEVALLTRKVNRVLAATGHGETQRLAEDALERFAAWAEAFQVAEPWCVEKLDNNEVTFRLVWPESDRVVEFWEDGYTRFDVVQADEEKA